MRSIRAASERLAAAVRSRPRAAAAAGLSLAVVSFLALRSGPADVAEAEAFRVRRMDVRRGIWALGELVAGSSVVVKSRLPGTDARILWVVEDGANVKEGDVLVRLDSSGFERDLVRVRTELEGGAAALKAQRQIRMAEETRVQQSIASAQSKADAARLRLRGLEQGDGPMEMRRFETEYHGALDEHQRWSRYLDDLRKIQKAGQDIGGELESATRKTGELEEKMRLAKQQFEGYRDFVFPSRLEEGRQAITESDADLVRTREAGGYSIGRANSEIEKAESQVHALENRVKELTQVISDATIRAPAPGLVVLRENHMEGKVRKPQVGDKIYQDFPLLELPDVSRMEVRARVREIDLEMLKPSQEAEAVVEAFPGKSYPGEVKTLGALALKKEGEDEKYFGVSCLLKKADASLRPGMTTRLFLVTERRRSVLAVPRELVARRGGVSYCRLGGNGRRPSERRVETGLEGNQYIEIRSGLRENDVVVPWR